MKKYLILWLLAVILLPLNAADMPGTAKPVKYVFLFIGDGMSLPQRMLTREYLNRMGKEDLRINRLPVHGITTTHCGNSLITDSAAAGTAIACGTKTNSGVLGLDSAGKHLESVAELARNEGRRVGIVTSVSIDHATPAAFYAHNPGRGNYYAIGLELIAAKFDFFGGGNFLGPDGKDGSLYELAARAGYKVIRDKATFEALKPGDAKFTLTLTPVTYAIDSGKDQISLAEYTAKAIAMLDNPDGFFLMVEGGRIDWACHANDAATVLQEVIAFDQAVEVACNFIQAHPGDALLVVTGDHETGALTLGFAGTGYSSFLERLQYQKVSYEKFGAILKKLRDSGSKSFDDVKPLITGYFGLKFDGAPSDPMLLAPHEQARIKTAFELSMGAPYTAAEPESVLYGGYNPLCVTLTHILANKSGIGWNSYAHTALPVSTTAFGKNAEQFSGMNDNTDIAKRLKPLVARLQQP